MGTLVTSLFQSNDLVLNTGCDLSDVMLLISWKLLLGRSLKRQPDRDRHLHNKLIFVMDLFCFKMEYFNCIISKMTWTTLSQRLLLDLIGNKPTHHSFMLSSEAVVQLQTQVQQLSNPLE